VTGAARSLERRAQRLLLTRRAAEAAAVAGAALLAVGIAARLEGWASPALAASAAALAALAAFWAAGPARRSLSASLSAEADEDALLRTALKTSAGAEWGELLARAAERRRPAFEPSGDWIPAAILAAGAVFALAWQSSQPAYAPTASGPAAGSAAAAGNDAAQRPGVESSPVPQPDRDAGRDGDAASARGEWHTLEPAAAAGSILLPPGAAARERSAIERYLRQRAAAQ
jgi:hypothetical protein